MVEFKLVLSDPKSAKSIQRDLKEESTKVLIGKKIGDTVKGEVIGLPGYEFLVTGGSDASGFPMRRDVSGINRKRITAVKGIGVKNKLRKPNPKNKGWRTMQGMRLKKTVAGDTIHAKTAQVNMKVLKYGKEALFGEPAKEGASAESPKNDAVPKKDEAKGKKTKNPKPASEPAVKDNNDSTEKQDKALKAADEIESAVKKDEEDLKVEDSEIAEIEGELGKVDSDIDAENKQ